ncbi:MAG TPA: DUF2637 domain-containing protein [Micromonosporaceae bacterium]
MNQKSQSKTDSPQNSRRGRKTKRLDQAIRVIVALTVALLAFVSGAISFDHLHLLAESHHQFGWRAVAFPISVDGLELVASLVILAEHRAKGHARALLPWVALGAGTVASLAANIAVGPDDMIGRAISGWPAIGLLVTLKLAAGRLSGPDRSAGLVRPARSVLVLDGSEWSDDGPNRSELGPVGSAAGPLRSADADQRSASRPAMVPVQTGGPELADLVAHARRVRDAVIAEGRRLTRRELAERLRADGRPVSNERATDLVRALTLEATRRPTRSAVVEAGRGEPASEAA